jgi:hypothetical protein
MPRTARALAGLLLLVPFAEAFAAQPAAPSWYRQAPAQKGHAIAKATADSKLAALADAIVALAIERSARRRPAAAAGDVDSVSFGAIHVRTTKTIVAGEKSGKVEKTRATIEMKTATGSAVIDWTREAPIAQGKTARGKRLAAKRVFNADMVKTSADDLVAELRRAGVTVRTASAPGRHYVLLKVRIPPGEGGTQAR